MKVLPYAVFEYARLAHINYVGVLIEHYIYPRIVGQQF